MPAPINPFKAALAARTPQIGLWLALASPVAAELCAHAGFDWLVVDGEHAPNDIPSILAQVQAIGSRSHAVVRPPVGEVHRIKQILDIGVQTVLVPMIETADQARLMARAMVYPPHGVRGVGAALARASAYSAIPDYLTTANDQTCLILQVESRTALTNIEAIAEVSGADGILIGPSDLAADMGFLGRPGAPEVQVAVEAAIARIIASGKPAGIMTGDLKLAQHYLDLGATFVAVGNDVSLLMQAATHTRRQFASDDNAAAPKGY